MAYAIVNRFADATKENYDAVVKVVHPDGELPPGQTHHFAGPANGDWVVMAVWDEKGSWDRFRDEVLMPTLRDGVAGGFQSPPEVTEFELDIVRGA